MIRDNLVAFLKTLGEEDLRFILGEVASGGKPGQTPPSGLDRPAAPPARAFDIPPDIKHLEAAQLARFTESCRTWGQTAGSPARRRSGIRLLLLFLLVRYGALKLGEAIAVDDGNDLRLAESQIMVRGEPGRTVQLPKEISREIARLLEDPAVASLRGTVCRLDQGFVRRKLYERADACGIPRELANPRVIRHSRAIELLREGVPLTVVQSILGHQSASLTAQYVNLSEEDIKRIVTYYIIKETRMKTSARNSFAGKVTAIRTGGVLAEVEVTTPSGLTVVSVITHDSMANLGITKGRLVTATVKAPWVILLQEGGKIRTSARNMFTGKVVKVTIGQIAAEIVLELPDGTRICSLITDESAKALDLTVGDEICAAFKAFSVILNVE